MNINSKNIINDYLSGYSLNKLKTKYNISIYTVAYIIQKYKEYTTSQPYIG